MTEIREGTVLAGYRLERLLGRGGMGTVWLATQEALERKVALKLLAPEISADPKFRARFLSESRLAASIDHPNIVPVFEAGEADGELFLAMRYVEGTDLDSLIAAEGAMAPGRVVGLLTGIADALDEAHARGLVHRDVKPSNILVAPGQRGEHAYLSDFGLTKRLGSSDALTRTGQVIGSVGYLAPEAIEGGSVDHRADIYSLGCVLYAALSGHPPYERDTDLAVLWAHVKADPPTLAPERPELAVLDAVIARALAKDPEARFASAGEMLDAAAAAAGVAVKHAGASTSGLATDESLAAAPATPSLALAGAGRGRRTFALVGAAALGAVLLAVLAVGGGLLGGGPGPSPSERAGTTDGSSTPDAGPTVERSVERILYTVRAPRGFDAVTDCVVDSETPNTIGRAWSIDPATGEQVRVLPTSTSYEHWPVWAPDGQRLVYIAGTPDFNSELRLAASDGGGSQAIGRPESGPYLAPAIADNGRVAWVHGDEGALSVANADGSAVTPVPLAFPPPSAQDKPDLTRVARVTWLPDGRLGMVTGGGDVKGMVWVVATNGTGLTRVGDLSDVTAVDWSPDGRRIVYSAGAADAHAGDIFVADADGSDPTALTGPEGDDVDPTWSPDGTHIAFASSRDGNYEIHVMGADGGDRRRLTTTTAPQFACAPSWGRTENPPITSPAPSPDAPVALERGWADAGTYRSDIFQPSIGLTLGDGWTVGYLRPDAFYLYRPGLDLDVGLVQLVFPGGCVMTGENTQAEGMLAGRTARDLIDWISGLPGLKVSQPDAVLVGDHPGLSVDIEAVTGPPCHDGTPLERRVGLFSLADQDVGLRVPGKARLVVVDVRGTPITFVYQGEDRLFDSVLDPIVESITFPED
jgi:serine/threonine-protein kinase